MPDVHSTAVIGEDVELGQDVTVGPHSVFEGTVRVGEGTTIAPKVYVRGPAEIGPNNRLETGCVIGTIPQDRSYDENVDSGVEIGSSNTLREYVTVNRATESGGTTRIGNETMIMAYSHIAHDCHVGDQVDMANGVFLSGHVTIDDRVFVSGSTGVHQFVRIGSYAMVGGLSRVVKDVVPYSMVSGNPLEVYGLNSVGLRRHGVSPEERTVLKQAFKILFRDNNNTSQALEKLHSQFPDENTVKPLIEFIENSERGIHK